MGAAGYEGELVRNFAGGFEQTLSTSSTHEGNQQSRAQSSLSRRPYLFPDYQLTESVTNMKVDITAYHAVALWKWDLPGKDDDSCGICPNPYDGACFNCKFPGDDCPPSMVQRP